MSVNEASTPTIIVVGLPDGAGEDRWLGQREPKEVVEQAVDINTLRQKFTQFMSSMEQMLTTEIPSAGPFQLSQIEFSAEISASGDFKLLGTGVGVSGSSTITFVLERR